MHRLVRRDRHDAELVGLVQLGGLGLRGAGHPGELLVEPEVVLQGDGGQGLVLGLDLDALFGLDRLVHALVVAAAVQHPAGELVDDQHLAGDHDVVAVLLVELLGLERVVQEADQRGVRPTRRGSRCRAACSTLATPSSLTPTVRLDSSTS